MPEPRFMDRGPRPGVTGAVFTSDLDICKGVGRRARAVVRGSRTLVLGLAEAVWVPHQMGREVGQSDKTDQPSTGSSFL